MLPIKNTQLVRTTFALRAKAELPADVQWVCSLFLSLQLKPEHLSYSVFLCFFFSFHTSSHPSSCLPTSYLPNFPSPPAQTLPVVLLCAASSLRNNPVSCRVQPLRLSLRDSDANSPSKWLLTFSQTDELRRSRKSGCRRAHFHIFLCLIKIWTFAIYDRWIRAEPEKKRAAQMILA